MNIFGTNGNDTLLGGNGDDTYQISSRDFDLYDSGTDAAIVSTSFVKLPPSIETDTYANGGQAPPYWINDLLAGDAARFDTLLGPAQTLVFRHSRSRVHCSPPASVELAPDQKCADQSVRIPHLGDRLLHSKGLTFARANFNCQIEKI